jgi:hypothetical protein
MVQKIDTSSTDLIKRALARFYPKPSKWPEIIKLNDESDLFLSDLIKILHIDISSVPFLNAFWDGYGYCQVTLTGLAQFYEALDRGFIEIDIIRINLYKLDSKGVGYGPQKHRTLINQVVVFLQEEGIPSGDINIEAAGFGGRTDIAIENRSLHIECGNSRPEKTLKTLSNGYHQIVVPYPNNDNYTEGYHFMPVQEFKVMINPYGAHSFNESGISDFLQPEEFLSLLDQINVKCSTGCRNYSVLMLMGSAGLRVSEVINLTKGDIDFDHMALTIKPNDAYRRERNINLNDQTFNSLCKWDSIRPDADKFFCTLKGGTLAQRYIRALVERKSIDAGIKKTVNPQILRHSYVASLIKQGTSNNEIISRTHIHPQVLSQIQAATKLVK